MKTERQDVYTQVTNTIIAAIEAGAGDWQMPWHRSGQGLNRPVNIDTANAYRGINVVSLWASAQARGFSTGVWGTYRQWQSKDCQVRKGEKSSLVVFYKEFDVEEQNDDDYLASTIQAHLEGKPSDMISPREISSRGRTTPTGADASQDMSTNDGNLIAHI